MTKSPIDGMDFVLGVVDAWRKIHTMQQERNALRSAIVPGISGADKDLIDAAYVKLIGMHTFTLRAQFDRFKPPLPPTRGEAESALGLKKKPRIIPVNRGGDHHQGSLVGIKKSEIDAVLGFTPNISDDPFKVKHSWGFMVDGVRCGVWDYKGSWRHGLWSTFGPDEELSRLFGENYKSTRTMAD